MTQRNDEVLARGDFLELRRDGRWEYVQRVRGRGAAFILALTDADEIVLVEQYRVPLRARVIEPPAGIVGDGGGTSGADGAGESALLTAARELEEETGFRARHLVPLLRGPSSPGMSSELLELFLATGLERVGPGGGADEDEDITVHIVRLDGVDAWLRAREAAGLLIEPRVYACLYFAQQHRHRAGR